MRLMRIVFLSVVLMSVGFIQAQNPANTTTGKSNQLSFGLGIGNTVLYDASFSLVRQIGLGPNVHASFRHSNGNSLHVIGNTLAYYNFNSDVANPDYAISGEHLHEQLNYTYLHQFTKHTLDWAIGGAFGLDFSQIKPEGLVINNAPLHDFNLQLQLAAKADYPFHLFQKNWNFGYQLHFPLVAYNSRPDYLGFTEFSGDSKYFNENGEFTSIQQNYFYINQSMHITLNCSSQNAFALNYNWYYANNSLANNYQNLNNALLVTYTRNFTSN